MRFPVDVKTNCLCKKLVWHGFGGVGAWQERRVDGGAASPISPPPFVEHLTPACKQTSKFHQPTFYALVLTQPGRASWVKWGHSYS